MRNKLVSERHKRGWTQEQVATKVGISTRTYQNYESGRNVPKLPIANRLEDLFKVKQRELLEVDSNTEGR